jgi:signal transduction histidine kinase
MLRSDIISILLILSSIISLGVGYFLTIGERRGEHHDEAINDYLSLLLAAGAAWNLSIFWMLQTGFQFLAGIPFFITSFLPPFTFLLISRFAGKSSKRIFWLAILPAVLMALATLWPGAVVGGYHIESGYIVPEKFGSLFPIFFSYFVIYSIIIFIQLFKSLKIASGIKRLQLIYLIIGFGLAALFGSLFNLVLPVFHVNELNNVGPIFILFITSATAYAIDKHYIYDISVVLSEMWAFLLLLVAITWILLNLSAFNFILFLLVVSICFLFIRSVVRAAEKNLELKKQKRQLERDKEELQLLDKMKDDFLKMSTHELNTPVVLIQGKMSMIFDENLGGFSDEQKEFLRPVFNNSTRLVRLFKEVLSTLKIDQKKDELLKMETNLNETFLKIVDKMKKMATLRNIEIIYSKVEMPELNIDPIKIQEVLVSLLENAIKFAPENGKVVLNTSIINDELIVSVFDNGVGISEADKKYIFTKFFQAKRFDEKNPLEQQGAGLGLYIAKKYIEAHGGRMWFDSKEGEGSKFYFSLPI